MSAPKISLVPFRPEHVERTFGWVSDPELRKLFLMRGEPTPEGHAAYFEQALADSSQRVLAVLADGEHVGNCGVKGLVPGSDDGELWIYIGSAESRGKGLGSAGTATLLGFAFGVLELARVHLHVAEFNLVARKMYERLGFDYAPMSAAEAATWADTGFSVLRMELRRAEWT